jgi:thioredoxin 1
MSVIFEIKDGNTLNEVMTSSYDIIIIDIYADWCGPCKYLAPKLENLAKQYSSSNILFCKLNSESGLKPSVKGLPTIEFWVSQSKGVPKQLFHTVLGADYPEIEANLMKLAGPPEQKQQSLPANPKQAPVNPIPPPQNTGFKTKSGNDSRQYRTYGSYSR